MFSSNSTSNTSHDDHIHLPPRYVKDYKPEFLSDLELKRLNRLVRTEGKGKSLKQIQAELIRRGFSKREIANFRSEATEEEKYKRVNWSEV